MSVIVSEAVHMAERYPLCEPQNEPWPFYEQKSFKFQAHK